MQPACAELMHGRRIGGPRNGPHRRTELHAAGAGGAPTSAAHPAAQPPPFASNHVSNHSDKTLQGQSHETRQAMLRVWGNQSQQGGRGLVGKVKTFCVLFYLKEGDRDHILQAHTLGKKGGGGC